MAPAKRDLTPSSQSFPTETAWTAKTRDAACYAMYLLRLIQKLLPAHFFRSIPSTGEGVSDSSSYESGNIGRVLQNAARQCRIDKSLPGDLHPTKVLEMGCRAYEIDYW